jgi:hypothetical protein
MLGVSSNLAGPRLLIADDHTIFADTLRAYLEKTYTVLGWYWMVALWLRMPCDSDRT